MVRCIRHKAYVPQFVRNYLTHLIHYQHDVSSVAIINYATVIYFYVTLSQNYKRMPKPSIFLVFVFVEDTINKYILENPQNKLCNISKLETKGQCSYQKCADSDDSISDVSISEINDYEDVSHLILSISRSKGRKRLFKN